MLINTEILDQFNISVNEYKLCNLISRSQTLNGWCNKTRKELAKELNVSEIYMYRMLKHLREIGLLEKYPSHIGRRKDFLRVTKTLLDEVVKM